jgi:hypothetical protein
VATHGNGFGTRLLDTSRRRFHKETEKVGDANVVNEGGLVALYGTVRVKLYARVDSIGCSSGESGGKILGWWVRQLELPNEGFLKSLWWHAHDVSEVRP